MEFSESGGMTFTIPSIEWSMVKWYYFFYASAVWGFLTHMKTLPAIHRFNRKLTNTEQSKRRRLTPLKLFGVLLCRMIIVVPWRFGSVVVGVAWIFLSFISTGVPSIRNDALKEAWTWHLSADDLSMEWGTSQKKKD